MIPLADLQRLLDSGADRVWYHLDDATAGSAEVEGTGPAVILVSEVTDAVKQVEDGMVVGSLDRALLWAVVGFELDREVVAGLGGGEIDPGDLIGAVRAVGYSWQVVPVRDSGS